MKHINLSALLLLFPFWVLSQTDGVQLDSIESKWFDSNTGSINYGTKNIYGYDEAGNFNRLGLYEWDRTIDGWKPISLVEDFFGSQPKRASGMSYVGTNMGWELEKKHIYSYDSLWNLVELQTEKWLADEGIYQLNSKIEYSYTPEGLSEKNVDYIWDELKEEWVPRFSIEITYNDMGDRILRLTHRYNESEVRWEPDTRIEYILDPDGNLVSEDRFQWQLERWIPNSRSTYTYDSLGNKLSLGLYGVNTDTESWKPQSMLEFTYNDENQRVTEVFFVWDSDIEDWNRVEARKYEFTSDGDFSEIVRWQIGASGDSTLKSKTEFEYDESIPMAEIKAPSLLKSKKNKIPLTEIEYDYITGNWVENWRTTYHYSGVSTTSIKPTFEESVQLYPNPVKDKLQINLPEDIPTAKIILFDTQNRLVLDRTAKDKQQIDLRRLVPGVYFYRIQADGIFDSGKLLKLE